MPSPEPVTLAISDEDAMTRLGVALAGVLKSGDTVLLSGPIGAGKSHLARAIIHAFIGPEEHVPSPTFTLVQTYEAGGTEIWHTDLYRLADSSELVELGLDEAIGSAIVLVEWPDRLPIELIPENALRVGIHPGDQARGVTMNSDSERWANTLTELADV